MNEARAKEILADLPGATLGGSFGVLSVEVPAESYAQAATFVKERLGCRYFAFLTAIDHKEAGLEVVARLDNLEASLFLTLRAKLGPGNTHCPSLHGVYRGADWMERECFDMFGIVFDGHPDLRRMLLPDDWEGHPLLKSYAVDTPHPPYR